MLQPLQRCSPAPLKETARPFTPVRTSQTLLVYKEFLIKSFRKVINLSGIRE